MQIRLLTPLLARLSLGCCDKLASRCYDVEKGTPNVDTLRSDSIWHARLCCKYLHWVLTTAQQNIVSFSPPPERAVLFINAFWEEAYANEEFEDLQLASKVMLAIQKIFYLMDPKCVLEHPLNMHGTKLLLKLAPEYDTPSWHYIEEFQATVTKHIWPLIEFTMTYASRNPASGNVSPSAVKQSEARPQPASVTGSFLDAFSSSTPQIAIVACKDIGALLAHTDDSFAGDNCAELRERLTDLWVTQGASGWALVWLQGILGPLRKKPDMIDRVRQVTALKGKSSAFETAKD